MFNIHNSWESILSEEIKKDYFKKLIEYLDVEYNNYNVYPPKKNIFQALKLTELKDIKIVIIGQDPYIKFDQAHGLAFSVNNGIKVPPSLLNIFKEINSDLDIEIPNHGCLIDWAKEGVLLLNTILTVRENESHSHKNKGWEYFTDAIIDKLNSKDYPIVFMLWGNNAISKQKLIKNKKFLVLTAPHPSPLSAYRGFFGCSHFSKANKFLLENNIEPVNWKLKE